jgi:multiple sugar transport system ATP-binding protein
LGKLVLENLSRRFGAVEAVTDVSLSIGDGEFVVLLGPSGCGKTTTLRMIAGLEEVSAGNIYLDGQRLNDVLPAERNIAMVFQNYALYPHMTVYNNMAFGLKMRHTPKPEVKARVARAADILGISHLLERYPRELSGGQRQRVAVGRAIVRDPRVFLFDEPLSNLDAKLRAQTRVELLKLHRQLGATSVYVTHDQIEAMTMGDRIVVMHDGSVQQVGAPMEIYRKPANRFVAGFIGTPPMNFFRAGVISEGGQPSLRGEGIRIPLAPEQAESLGSRGDDEVLLGIRPENLLLQAPSPDIEPLRARIEIVEAIGSDLFLNFTHDGAPMTARVEPSAPVKTGDEVALYPDLRHVHLFDPKSGARL